jgi:pilus assembly protein Flp/PilA
LDQITVIVMHPWMHLAREERHMKNFTESIVNFLKEEDGPTAVEYAVMLALIIVVCLTAVGTIGSEANTKFEQVGAAIAAN